MEKLAQHILSLPLEDEHLLLIKARYFDKAKLIEKRRARYMGLHHLLTILQHVMRLVIIATATAKFILEFMPFKAPLGVHAGIFFLFCLCIICSFVDAGLQVKRLFEKL